MNNKNNRSVRRTKAALYRSFIELASQKSPRSITINELTEASDVSRSTFYTHYHDVFELMECIGNDLIEKSDLRFQERASTTTPTPNDPANSPMLESICEFIYDNAQAFSVLLGENGDPGFQQRLANVICKDGLASMTDLYGRIPDEHVEDFGTFMSSGCIGLVKAWLAEEHPTEPHAMALRFGLMIKGSAYFLVEGIRPEKGME